MVDTEFEIQQARVKLIGECRNELLATIGVILTQDRRVEIGKILKGFAEKVREAK